MYAKLLASITLLAFFARPADAVDTIAVNSTKVRLDIQKLALMSISNIASAHARNSTQRKLLESQSQTQSISFTCGYASDEDCYDKNAPSSCDAGLSLSCGYPSRNGQPSYCVINVDYASMRCLLIEEGYSYSEANTYSRCSYWDLGVKTSAVYHGGDLSDGECNLNTRPLMVTNSYSCDSSRRIQVKIKWSLMDTSKTLVGLSFETQCTSRFRSDETITYTYTTSNSPSLGSTSGASRRTRTFTFSALIAGALTLF